MTDICTHYVSLKAPRVFGKLKLSALTCTGNAINCCFSPPMLRIDCVLADMICSLRRSTEANMIDRILSRGGKHLN